MDEKSAEDLRHNLDMYSLIRAARGSTNQAKNTLEHIADLIEKDRLHEPLKEWIVLSLRKISQGADANKTLFVSGTVGRYSVEDEDRAYMRDRSLYFELQAIKLENPKIKIGKACESLCERLGLESGHPILSEIKKIHKSCSESDEELLATYSRLTDVGSIRKSYRKIGKEMIRDFEKVMIVGGKKLVAQTDFRPLFK
jgi:hypothetical protein